MPKTYIIRDIPEHIHTRLQWEADQRGVSVPNILRLLISERLAIEWPLSQRGNHGANKGKKINQPKGKRRKKNGL